MLPYSSPICRHRATVPIASLVHLSWPFLSPNHPHSGAKQTSSGLGVSSPSLLSTSLPENGLTWVVVTEEAEFPSISSHPDSGTTRMSAPQSSPHSLSLTTQTGLAWTITTDEEQVPGQVTSVPSHTHRHLSSWRRCQDGGRSTIPPKQTLLPRVCDRQVGSNLVLAHSLSATVRF